MAANANPVLLAVLYDLHGKDVLIETVDKSKWRGIFSACSPENLKIGTKLTYQITESNKANLLPLKSEVVPRLTFKFVDIVAITTILEVEGASDILDAKTVMKKNQIHILPDERECASTGTLKRAI
ncbi:hypothetical protein WR25_00281 [Diploscapter pachys]|uniref:Ataxin 2 SM domain-containing protein n=1 Tax=Diploscapter pachys TaxID=2018661 RepID=A0A2A2KV92_9BILA|nr:hypothetical protein WR25_00281 [Diploscapter pachys]